jgi:hypothetical protein
MFANIKYKLPLWPFWDKNPLTGLEIHSWSKNKKYSPFLSQRDKGSTKYSEKNHNQTFPKKQTKEDNKIRASTRIQHTHVSKLEKTIR